MKMLIGGKFIDSSDGAKMDVVNPATGKIVDTVPAGTLEDLDKAISLAVEGQKEWNAVPLHERLRILEKYACLMEESVEEISKVMCEEGGSPLSSAGPKSMPMRLFSEFTVPLPIPSMERPFLITGSLGLRVMW